MSGLAKKWVESFRALPQGLRDELLAKIVVDDKSVSRARLERIALILDRHVFRGETPRELCKTLKLSRQQFYADLREGVRRLNVLLDRKEHGSSAVVLYNPRELIVSQAHAAYQAGMSRRAADLLQRVHSAPLRAIEAAEAAALELEVFEDLMRPLASFHTGLDLIADARARAENGSNDDERAIFTATMHWIQTYLSCYAGDRSRFLLEYDAMVALLRSRAFGGHRDAAVAFCRFTLSALLLLEDFDQGYLDGTRAERALADVEELLRMRDDMPMTMAASMHARYAAFYNGRATTAHRSREARALAYKHGIDRASTVSVWYALGMEVTDNLARGDTAHALACATALHESVQASDSIEWQLPARSRLALAFNALGRFDDAERTISIYEARRAPYRPHAIIPTCEMLLGRGRYRECSELATLLVENVKGMHHASALIYRAKAAYQIGDAKSAAADIKNAVAMCDSLHGQSFYRVCSAYRAAYEITGEKRYRDTLHAIETLLEDDAFNTPLLGAARGLTTRQREIARLAASGETNRAIARRLGLSPRTVGNSLNAAYERLGVRARWQLAAALQGKH